MGTTIDTCYYFSHCKRCKENTVFSTNPKPNHWNLRERISEQQGDPASHQVRAYTIVYRNELGYSTDKEDVPIDKTGVYNCYNDGSIETLEIRKNLARQAHRCRNAFCTIL